jgi:hypothetical protein
MCTKHLWYVYKLVWGIDAEIRVQVDLLHSHRANIRHFVSLTGCDNTVWTASQPRSCPSNGDSFAQASLGTALYYIGQQLEP